MTYDCVDGGLGFARAIHENSKALAANGDARDIYTDEIIDSVSGGRRDPIILSLVDAPPEQEILTHLGAEIIRFARNQHRSILA